MEDCPSFSRRIVKRCLISANQLSSGDPHAGINDRKIRSDRAEITM